MGLEMLILVGIENLIYPNATDSLAISQSESFRGALISERHGLCLAISQSESSRGALIWNDEIFNAADQLFQAHRQRFCAQLIKRTE